MESRKNHLFGSHARGTADPDSDIDLLVILKVHRSKREIRLAIRHVLSGIGILKDIVGMSSEEVGRYRDCPGTTIRTALRERVR